MGRLERLRGRLSCAELARRIGWDRSRLWLYEQGKRVPGVEDLEAIADALGFGRLAVVLFYLEERYPELRHVSNL